MKLQHKHYITPELSQYIFNRGFNEGTLDITIEGTKGYATILFILVYEEFSRETICAWQFDDFKEGLIVFNKLKQKLQDLTIRV